MYTSANMGLAVWNDLADEFDHGQLEDNWAKVDTHSHVAGQGVQIPTGGIADSAITDPKIAAGTITDDKIAANTITGDKVNTSTTLTVADVVTPLVTTLPSSPYDGQTVNLLVDTTNGVVWRFRYRTASSSAYKWEFIGGPPLVVRSTTLSTVTTSSYAGLTPAVVAHIPTLPSGGDFDVTLGATINIYEVFTGSATLQDDFVTLSYATNVAAVDTDGLKGQMQNIIVATPGTSGYEFTGTQTTRKTGLPSGQAITVQGKCFTGTSANYEIVTSALRVIPVRVG